MAVDFLSLPTRNPDRGSRLGHRLRCTRALAGTAKTRSHLSRCVAIGLLALTFQSVRSDEASQSPPVRVGVLHSLTGTMAISEKSLVDACQMAIGEINQQGGVLGRPLKAVIEDGESDPQVFARRAEKLIVEDQVASVFGCWTSSSRKAVLPVFEKHNHLLWYPVQYEGGESSPNIIYTGAAPNQQITPAVEWCHAAFGPRMFLVGSDYVFPRTANVIIRQQLAGWGASPVGEEYRPLGSQDFEGIVRQIAETQPDVVLNTINGDSNQAFFAALSKAGIDAQTIPVMSFSIAEDELRSIDTGLTTGHYCCWNYFQSVDTPANRRFVRKFRERYGISRVTDDPIEAAYSQVHLFAKAVEKAGSTDVAAIREAARGLIFSAPGGLIRIDPQNQHTWKVARIGRIERGRQFSIVWSSEDPLPPRPYLPEHFVIPAREHGDAMFDSISEMIDLEIDESVDSESRELLKVMTDIHGFLGDARLKFFTAVLVRQPQSRADFEQAWKTFGQRCDQLLARKQQLTEDQTEALERFETARSTFNNTASFMFDALYDRQPTAPGGTQ